MKKKLIAVLLLAAVFIAFVIPLSVLADVKTVSVNNFTSGIRYSSARSNLSRTGAYDCYNSASSPGIAACRGQYAHPGYGWVDSSGDIAYAAAGNTSITKRAYSPSSREAANWRVALWSQGNGLLVAANAVIRD